MGIFLFDEHTSDEFGIYTAEKDIHSAPARDQSIISVPGRSGDVVIDNGRYENVNVSYTCYCKDLVNDMYKIKAWLCRPGYCALQDQYDPLLIRYACFFSNLKVDELINNVGKFTVNFNCKPFLYSNAGTLPQTKTSSFTIVNPEKFASLPLLKIYGSSSGTLHINSRSYAFTSIPTNLDVDSELMCCYKGNVLYNDRINFTEFPYLEPGNNSISWTGGITKVTVTPRWRTL